MNKPYFIELTSKLYRLTFFFPSKEPLRNKIREVGDDILADLVLILEGEIGKRRESAFSVEKNIEIMDALLELSKAQKWIDSEEIRKIQEKYKEIQEEVEEFNDILRRNTEIYEKKALMISEGERKEKSKNREEEKVVEKKSKPTLNIELNERQKKIMDILNKKEKVQVKDIQEVLPKTVKRTLRRDLGYLVEKKAIKRFGKGNATYYSKKA